jgi:hypothetical protein
MSGNAYGPPGFAVPPMPSTPPPEPPPAPPDGWRAAAVAVRNLKRQPRRVTVLYSGPVTGSFTLKGCGSCKAYSSTWCRPAD